jgi:hypothetical protein
VTTAEKHRVLQALSEAAAKTANAHHAATEALLAEWQDHEAGIRTVAVACGWMAYDKNANAVSVSVSEGPMAALNNLRAMLAAENNKEDNA